MQKIEAIIRPERLDEVKNALAAAGVSGLNIVHVTGRGVHWTNWPPSAWFGSIPSPSRRLS